MTPSWVNEEILWVWCLQINSLSSVDIWLSFFKHVFMNWYLRRFLQNCCQVYLKPCWPRSPTLYLEPIMIQRSISLTSHGNMPAGWKGWCLLHLIPDVAVIGAAPKWMLSVYNVCSHKKHLPCNNIISCSTIWICRKKLWYDISFVS